MTGSLPTVPGLVFMVSVFVEKSHLLFCYPLGAVRRRSVLRALRRSLPLNLPPRLVTSDQFRLLCTSTLLFPSPQRRGERERDHLPACALSCPSGGRTVPAWSPLDECRSRRLTAGDSQRANLDGGGTAISKNVSNTSLLYLSSTPLPIVESMMCPDTSASAQPDEGTSWRWCV